MKSSDLPTDGPGSVEQGVRTSLEDRTLHRGLSGFDAYAKQTRFRLCPGIW